MSTAVTEIDASSWAVGFCPIILINIIIIIIFYLDWLYRRFDNISSGVLLCKICLWVDVEETLRLSLKMSFLYREIQKSLLNFLMEFGRLLILVKYSDSCRQVEVWWKEFESWSSSDNVDIML